MTSPGYEDKLRRALKHLAEMEDVSSDFDQACRQQTRLRYDDSQAEYVVSIGTVPPVPRDFALAAGDALHNLRSALDHLARQLVLAEGLTPIDGPGGTTFPIRLQRSSGALLKPTPTSQAVLAALDAVQPYQLGPDSARHWLAILHGLDLADKHRDLLVGAGAVGGASTSGEFEQCRFGLDVIADGEDVAWFQTASGGLASGPLPTVGYFVYLNERSKTGGILLGAAFAVRTIHDYILREVVTPLAPFL